MPTSASWLNLVERWFTELTQMKLKLGVHRSVQALERDIRSWLADGTSTPDSSCGQRTQQKSSTSSPPTADGSPPQVTGAMPVAGRKPGNACRPSVAPEWRNIGPLSVRCGNRAARRVVISDGPGAAVPVQSLGQQPASTPLQAARSAGADRCRRRQKRARHSVPGPLLHRRGPGEGVRPGWGLSGRRCPSPSPWPRGRRPWPGQCGPRW